MRNGMNNTLIWVRMEVTICSFSIKSLRDMVITRSFSRSRANVDDIAGTYRSSVDDEPSEVVDGFGGSLGSAPVRILYRDIPADRHAAAHVRMLYPRRGIPCRRDPRTVEGFEVAQVRPQQHGTVRYGGAFKLERCRLCDRQFVVGERHIETDSGDGGRSRRRVDAFEQDAGKLAVVHHHVVRPLETRPNTRRVHGGIDREAHEQRQPDPPSGRHIYRPEQDRNSETRARRGFPSAVHPTPARALVVRRQYRSARGTGSGPFGKSHVGARRLRRHVDVLPQAVGTEQRGPQRGLVERWPVEVIEGHESSLTYSLRTSIVTLNPVSEAEIHEVPELHTTAGKLADLERRHHEATVEMAERASEKQHAKGRQSARERVDQLLDDGSFVELDAFARHRSTAFGLEKNRPLGDGVITGYGTIEGRQVCVFSQDFSIYGGSLGQVYGEKITKVMDLAIKNGCPIIGINEGAGARIQEGVVSLGLYGEIFRRNVHASGVIPQISLIMGSCAGGHVYSPAITDFTIMVDQTSNMFITGPDIIKTVTGEDVTMEELGGARTHNTKSGNAHYMGAAQFFHRDVFAGDGLDDVRSGDEHVRRLVDHDREIGDGRRVDVTTGARAHNERDLGDDARGVHIPTEDFAVQAERDDAFLNPRAGAFVDADDGAAVLDREIHDLRDFLAVYLAEAATIDREVL